MAFFGSLMGDFEDDPFTGHMRQMNRMMNSFFNASPFGSLMGGSADLMPYDNRRGRNALMPFGFPDVDRMFPGIDQTGANRSHSFTSSTIMTMSNGPDGRPQVYQASQSVRSGPGGVRETKKTVADSRTGVKKMAIGHHIGDRSHILEREQNVHSGEQEEREEFINLDEEEAPQFNHEWQTKTRSFAPANNAITYPSSSSRYGSGRRHHDSTPMLPPAPSQSTYRSRVRAVPNRRTNYNHYPALPPPPPQSNPTVVYDDNDDEDDDDDDNEEDDDEEGVKIVELDDDEDEVEESTQKKEKSRKREHEPDNHYKSKVQKMHRDSFVRK